MNTTRLYALGILARRGAMHGHQILREAELDRAEFWGAVQVGSLYAAVHRMEEEGLVRAIRTEQAGRYPARTVYEITDAGRAELRALRDAGFEWTAIRPDPFDLALSFADDLSEEELRVVVTRRLDAVAVAIDDLARQQTVAAPHLGPVDEAVIEHIRERLLAHRRWHEALLQRLPDVVGAAGRRPRRDRLGPANAPATPSSDLPTAAVQRTRP